MARRLLPITLLIPILFIWIRLLTDFYRPTGGSYDILIVSFLYIGIFAFFIWKVARSVNTIDLDRILTLKELEQSEQRFNLAFHSSPAALTISKLGDETIIDINGAYCTLVGKSRENLLGRSTTDLNLWADNSERDKLLAELRLKGKVHNIEIKIMKGEHEIRTVLASFEMINLHGESCILSSAIDITDLKLTEIQNVLANEILEHLNRYTDSEVMIMSVIKSIRANTGIEAVAIRIKNGEDYPYYKTSGLSDEFVEAEKYLCSYDKDGNVERDAEGDPMLECMCGNILCNRVDSTKSFFTDGGSFRSNNTSLLLASTTDEERLTRTRNRCNSEGYESVALIPLRSGSEIIGLLQLNDHRKNLFDEKIIPFFERIGSSIGIAIMRNKVENEIKQLNKELENRVAERTEQLMESNKELESFAYSVSHDLRAPLRHVIGFTEILESDLGEMADPEISRLTGTIKNSAHKMGQLIDELLNYSRLGRTKLKTIKISLNPLIEEVLKEASDITKKRDITWNINKLPDVYADPTLLRLVFQNLINNSIKFTGKKQKAVIEINFEEKGDKEYAFYIKDNGAGFDSKYANKLFGVFQRLHTSEEFEGTGIGLATVKRIVKRHGGSVWADGIHGEGATFCFTLPK